MDTLASTDLISNPVYDYCSPSLSAKRGPREETISQYRCIFVALLIFLLLSIVFFFLGCSIGYQYFHMETTFQRKIDSLNGDMTEIRRKNSELEEIISLLASNISATKSILGEATRKNIEKYDTFNLRAQTVEKNLNDLNVSSNALVGALKQDFWTQIESVVNEVKNLQQRISFVDNTTSFLIGTINVTNGNVMHLNSRMQEVIQKMDNLNMTSLKGSIQTLQQEVLIQKKTLENLDLKHEKLSTNFANHVG